MLFIHKHGMRNRRRNIVIERLKKSKEFGSMTKRFTGIHEGKIKLMSVAMDINSLWVYISDSLSNSSVAAGHDRSSIITLTNTVTYIYIYVSESCHDVREYGLRIELITFGERNEPHMYVAIVNIPQDQRELFLLADIFRLISHQGVITS